MPWLIYTMSLEWDKLDKEPQWVILGSKIQNFFNIENFQRIVEKGRKELSCQLRLQILISKEQITEILKESPKKIELDIQWTYQTIKEIITNKEKTTELGKETSKQIMQRLYEHIPYTHFVDLYYEKWLISQTPIPRWSIWYRGRIAITAPQSGIIGEVCINGKKILYEAQTNIINIFQWEIPHSISTDMAIMMTSIALWTLIYYSTVKTGDAIQLRNKYNKKWEKIINTHNETIVP